MRAEAGAPAKRMHDCLIREREDSDDLECKNRVVVVGSTHNHVDVQLIYVEQCDITKSVRSDLRGSCGVSCSITHSGHITHDPV